jgi:predicted transcriptional regulator
MMTNKPSGLRLRRFALGLRIRDVANATGISDARISEIERGEGRSVEFVEVSIIEEFLHGQEARSGGLPAVVRGAQVPRGQA